jgi:hypothetical protein
VAVPEDIRVHVYSGRLDLDLGGRTLALGEGDSAIVADGVAVGATRQVAARVRWLRRAIGDEVVARRREQERLTERYADQLAGLRRAERQAPSSERRAHIERLEALLRKHAAGLQALEAQHPEFRELDLAEAALQRLDEVRDAADREFGRLVTVVGALR